MEIRRLIELLSKAEAYGGSGQVKVLQTHISAVFLVGEYVYKVKKPVKLGFLDFSTLERRRHFCDEEVRLNRRLAPHVYLGVVPIVFVGDGLRVEGSGDVVEWAVKMVRLPAEATLEQRLLRGQLDTAVIERLASQVADFHARAERSEHISSFGRLEVVARNARENFSETRQHVGKTVTGRVWQRLQELTDAWLQRLGSLIDERARRQLPCDTHGDLHLDHVYLLDDALVIIDCIEFSERFRNADPVADMAFLVMDLLFHQRADLAAAFAERYFACSGDADGRALLPFYVAYRSIVRAKVNGIAADEAELPASARAAAAQRARAHWLLALQQLEEPGRRPALVLVGGLPGTGKSTLAKALAEQAGFELIRSDAVRKELAGVRDGDATSVHLDTSLYSPEWSERTYAECRRRAELLLADGRRVLVDATFRAERHRQKFVQLAQSLITPALFLITQARPEIVRERLAKRRNDVSDANWEVYVKATSEWEEPLATRQLVRPIATDNDALPPVDAALAALREVGVAAR
jgi:aminoglycoside phosphotransferase family enzyme/predicted kinase